jgi:sialate O-acetylesterase
MNQAHLLAIFLLGTLLPSAANSAELKLAALFSDHVVLQREKPVPVWGWATAGENVTVEFAGQTKTAQADADGKWLVRLDPMSASTEPRTLKVNDFLVSDVLVGDVWVCGGQSNMERQLGPRPPQPPIVNWEQEVSAANFPLIRHFGVVHKAAKEPLPDVVGSWAVCSPQTVKDFTAVGYFFGRELVQELNIPIGLLHSSWGGTGLATWTSPEALDSLPAAKDLVAVQLSEPKVGSKTPTILFQNMIRPLIPFAVTGAIWFQGESGAGLPMPYDKLFQVMITDWRKQWGLGDFPFYFVQLPNGSPDTREAQARALQLPNTGMAVTIDVGDPQDVHGPIKAPIGQRLARLALVKTYHREGECSGPVLQSAVVEGGSIRIKFSHTGSGLMPQNGGPLKYFTIAGEDKKFVSAEARIEDGTVVVSSPQITKPVAVRYAWVKVPVGGNLFNGDGLPAAPFRTDDWTTTP